MTNFEGRVLLRRAAFDPPAGVWTDLQILTALAGRLGRGELFRHDDARLVFDELRRASAGGIADYARITYERIAAEQGSSGPARMRHPGTPRLSSMPSDRRRPCPGSTPSTTGPGLRNRRMTTLCT